jgi:hypothetical protein
LNVDQDRDAARGRNRSGVLLAEQSRTTRNYGNAPG